MSHALVVLPMLSNLMHTFLQIRKHTITCTSSTKTFNLAGLQVATVIFPYLDMKKIR